MSAFAGTKGYSEQAPALFERYERLSFEASHGAIIGLIPKSGRAIGAGTGRDAAALARRGHHVVAVEPTAEFRKAAALRHPSPRISWIDDGLPDLRVVTALGAAFDFVLISAVWMHLDAQERAQAMPVVARLMARGAVLAMTLRHGPVPPGRLIYAVSPEETVRLAAQAGLRCLMNADENAKGYANLQAGVRWSRRVFYR